MTPEQFADMQNRLFEAESNLLAVTDKVGGLMDLVLQKGFVPAFRCNHSGLLLPGDYVKQWGRKYGIGLGPSPVSEVLDTDYETDAPDITPQIRSIEQIMHPVGPCFSQVDLVMVAPGEMQASAAILDNEDQGMFKRVAIVRPRQLENPRGRLRALQAKWETMGRKA